MIEMPLKAASPAGVTNNADMPFWLVTQRLSAPAHVPVSPKENVYEVP